MVLDPPSVARVSTSEPSSQSCKAKTTIREKILCYNEETKLTSLTQAEQVSTVFKRERGSDTRLLV